MERWVEFVRGGKAVGREVVSIVPAAEVKDLNSGAKGPKPGAGSSRVEMLKGDEYMRVWINRGGVNYLLCRFAFGDLTLAESLRSVELFASEVMPHFPQ